MPLRTAAARLFGQLCRALAERGEVTIRVADLAGRDGLTDFRSGVIYLDHRLTLAGARAALCHELVHLRNGPVPPDQAAAEEKRVRRETARTYVPAGHVLQQIGRAPTPRELEVWADRKGVDRRTIRDAFTPRTGGIPIQRVSAEGAA